MFEIIFFVIIVPFSLIAAYCYQSECNNETEVDKRIDQALNQSIKDKSGYMFQDSKAIFFIDKKD